MHDDAALLALVGEHLRAGVGARRIDLVQDRHRALAARAGDEVQSHVAVADVGQLVGGVEDLRLIAEVDGEKLRQRHRDAGQDLLQRADRRADAVLLDQRDHAVGDTGPLGQLALRQAVDLADRSQVGADVHRDCSTPDMCTKIFNIRAPKWSNRGFFGF